MLFARRNVHQPRNSTPRKSTDRSERGTQRIQREIFEARHARRDVDLSDFDAEREQRTERSRGEQRDAPPQVRVEPQVQTKAERKVQQYVRDSIAAPCPRPRQFLERLENAALDRVRFEVEWIERTVRDERDDRAEQPRDQRSRARHEKRGWRLEAWGWRANTSASIFWLQPPAPSLQPNHEVMIDQQAREQQCEVLDRECKRSHGQAGIASHLELECTIQEERTEHDRESQIDQAAHPRKIWQQRHDHEEDRIEKNVEPREVRAICDRQHRNAGFGVFVAPRDRQRPEMRRRPREDDQEQQQRVRIDAARDRCPAKNGWCGAGSATDHDVLRRRMLQPHGVDDRVADEREEGQYGGEDIDPPDQQQHRERTQQRCIRERLTLVHVPGRQRSTSRARHLRIEAAVQYMVDRGRRGCSERDADAAEYERVDRREARRREEHAGDRREHDEQHDSGLTELVEIAPRGGLLPFRSRVHSSKGGQCGGSSPRFYMDGTERRGHYVPSLTERARTSAAQAFARRRLAITSKAATPLCAVASASGNPRMTIRGPSTSCRISNRPSTSAPIRIERWSLRRHASTANTPRTSAAAIAPSR